MDMTGERRIPAPREKVWAALNDPEVLKASIPGCESLEKLSDTDLKATAAVKIGPIAARFTGKVQLLDLDPPSSYRIAGEGQGGVAGFAKGGANVRLAQEGEFTLLSYDVKAQVGGKIAQLGARLIDASAKQMADAFFDRFVAEVAATPAAEMAAEGPAGLVAAATGEMPGTGRPPGVPAPAPQISIFDLIPREPMGLPIVAWIGIIIFLAIFILIFGSSL
ncbi:MAG TPA: carbon monoxide dehydrogenase subunit G [Acetobacteraceae bacterium]|nr:carbon monoxide dehydrogenase subunit G [Acetobacteraceae bacterium]